MKHDHLQIQTLSHKSQPGGEPQQQLLRVWSGSIMISSSLLSGLAIVSWYSLGPSMMVANKYTDMCVVCRAWATALNESAAKARDKARWNLAAGWRELLLKGEERTSPSKHAFYCINGKLSLRAIQRHLNDKNWTLGSCMRKILRFSYFYRDSPRKILKSGLDGRVRWR
jgi:hypothetical protein